jgi:ADP-ribosylglycohydrolase
LAAALHFNSIHWTYRMNNPELASEVRRLALGGDLQICWHARLDKAPEVLPALNLSDKVEGMMLGLAIGDALGNTSESQNPADRRRRYGWIEDYLPNRHAGDRRVGLPSDDSQLAFWTVEHLLESPRLDPQRLGEMFASRQIFGGGVATAEALQRIRAGRPWQSSGSASAGNGSLMRIAAVMLPHLMRPSPEVWTDVLAAAHVTHDDELSNISCIAMVDLLWKLLGMHSSPESNWWFDQWMENFEDFGTGKRYAARGAHPPGFEGTIGQMLRDFVQPALERGLEVDAAGSIWHSGAYLLETVPTVIYILARFGHDPKAAIEQAVNNSRDNDTVAAIVGAAVGALHGISAWPDSWIDSLLGRTGHDDDGQAFRLLHAAGDRFGYGSTPRLQQLVDRYASQAFRG